MKRELILMRHAKSSRDETGLTDIERPLAPRGVKDARKIGEWMAAEGIAPDYILSSPAVRTRQTMEQLCGVMGVAEKKVHWVPELYAADLEILLSALARCPKKSRRVLLLGHNPELEELLGYLCGDELPRTDKGKLLTTACVAQVELPADWGKLTQRCGSLVRLTRVKSL